MVSRVHGAPPDSKIESGNDFGWFGWLARLLLALAVALAVSWLPFEVSGKHGFRHYVRLRRELRMLRSRNAELARQVRRLTKEVKALRAQGPAVERVARNELGYIRDGEHVYVIRWTGGAAETGKSRRHGP